MILHTKSELLELAAYNAPTAAITRSILQHGADIFRTPRGYLVLTRSGRLIELVPDSPHWKISWPVGDVTKLLANATQLIGEKL